MTNQELRQLKAEMDQALFDAINQIVSEFEGKTGLRVKCVTPMWSGIAPEWRESQMTHVETVVGV